MISGQTPRCGGAPTIPAPRGRSIPALLAALIALLSAGLAHADESKIVLPDFRSVQFLGLTDGHTLLLFGMAVSLVGFVFGVVMYSQIPHCSHSESPGRRPALLSARCSEAATSLFVIRID